MVRAPPTYFPRYIDFYYDYVHSRECSCLAKLPSHECMSSCIRASALINKELRCAQVGVAVEELEVSCHNEETRMLDAITMLW